MEGGYGEGLVSSTGLRLDWVCGLNGEIEGWRAGTVRWSSMGSSLIYGRWLMI
jgi:hypothetical protein